MKVLVVGSGGREHALAWKLAEEADVICAPGNPGMAEIGPCFPVAPHDAAGLCALCDRESVDLVVVGPEDPLIAGLADTLRAHGLLVFGPGADGARLEASKAWSKDLMREAGIPTAEYQSFTDAGQALQYAAGFYESGRAVAVKASGAALGKGVVVAETLDEAEDAIGMMMVEGELGDAGRTVVIEERLVGFEFSLLTLVSGTSFLSLPVAQDYKRALDGDRGPNTGGMGTYSPVATVPDAMVRDTEERVVRPLLELMAQRGIDYRGVLFSGLMVQNDKVYCLEYNVRFGDPETQTVMARIGGGLLDALVACAAGQTVPSVEVLVNAAVTVVMAAKGYPGSATKGGAIEICELGDGARVFHAGTAMGPSGLTVSGGRVLGVNATGASVEEARARAYTAVEKISAPSLRWRGDIGLR
jgi:phosphoribosylamine--glycine ligase